MATGRVLLTGASGFVGGAVLRRLLANGTEVVTLGRAREAPVAGLGHQCLDLLEADSAALVKAIEAATCDRLIHAAWYTDHADYLVAGVNRAWLEASMRLFQSFRATGAGRMLGLGTCAEYAPQGGRCSERDTPLRPHTLYGQCKLALSEALLRLPDTVWARVFFTYGPGDRAGRLVPRLIEQAITGAPLAVRYGGLRRDYIHVDDLAGQVAAIADSDVTGPINTGTGKAVNLAAIAEAAAVAAGRPELAVPNGTIDPSQAIVIEANMDRYERSIGPLEVRPLLNGLAGLVRPLMTRS